MGNGAKSSILTNALSNYDKAAEMLKHDVDGDILRRLRLPRERVELTLSPQLSDGKVHVLKAFIVQHSHAIGPAKGGIRMNPAVTIDDVNGLAMEMTWKCALIGVPFGGGKSGIVADSEVLSLKDKQTIIRSYTRKAYRHFGPQVYVPAPDMGTTETDMGHIKDAISNSVGNATTKGCYVTGKPVILGGIPGRREATGRGVAICVEKALKHQGIEPSNASVIIQGFGNVGSMAAMILDQMGVSIHGVSDLHGAIYNKDGIDITALLRHVKETGRVSGAAGADTIDGHELLEMPCDVLVPAAAASQITVDNADKIQARIVAEGANSPTTPEADEILEKRGIIVVPDILCNAGGVFVSYLEYTQETQMEQMHVEQVEERLHRRMADRFEKVLELSKERAMSMRDAAMFLAVKSVGEAIEARGYQP